MKPKSKRMQKAIDATMKYVKRLRDDYGPDLVDHLAEARDFERAIYRIMNAAMRVGQIKAQEAKKP